MGTFIRLNAETAISPEGGFLNRVINKTGAASVKGTIVRISTSTNEGAIAAPGDTPHPIGIVYNAGVADGSYCWAVVSGIAEILLKDSTSATVGNWVKVSDDTAGRADASFTDPPGGTIGELQDHMTEIGHARETKSGGTDVLLRVQMHFN